MNNFPDAVNHFIIYPYPQSFVVRGKKQVKKSAESFNAGVFSGFPEFNS